MSSGNEAIGFLSVLLGGGGRLLLHRCPSNQTSTSIEAFLSLIVEFLLLQSFTNFTSQDRTELSSGGQLNQTEQFEKDVDDRRSIERSTFGKSAMQRTQFIEHASYLFFVYFPNHCAIRLVSDHDDGNFRVVAALFFDLFDDVTDFLERSQTIHT